MSSVLPALYLGVNALCSMTGYDDSSVSMGSLRLQTEGMTMVLARHAKNA